ncbi:MAG: dihydrofolate reductase [Oscillospiraceae bacterium]
MTIILVADNDWAIGKDGGLLARLPEDMKHFRETTRGGVVLMGRKTWESFPKRPLPDRENCVLTRSGSIEGAHVFSDIESMVNYARSAEAQGKNVFVIGGGQVYSRLLPYCDKAIITRVYENFCGDTFFTDIDSLPEWQVTAASDVIETNGHKIRFMNYERIGETK